MRHHSNKLPGILFITAVLCFSGAYAKSEIFPTPPNLVDNVEFWKKIYAEVSTTEGLLHDYEYPLVTYKKVYVGRRTGRSRINAIRKEKKLVVSYLNIILSQPESSWSKEEKRIAKLINKYVPKDDRSGIIDRIRFQQGQKERFLSGLEKSGLYIDTIRTVLKQYNIPDRLAFLPHVESSFNTYAYSKVGAAGLWQFMRGTGKMYMTINYLVDERRDPFTATHAAAKHLRNDYDILGSWPLAITAYNHGLYGMKRAVARTGSKDIGTIIERHASRSFRFASKNFYSCFLAASEIAENPEKYFSTINYFPRLKVTDITLTHYIRPRILAEYLGISEKKLVELNPALRPVVFSQQKKIPAGYAIHLPAEFSAEKAQLALASIPDSLKSEQPDRPKYYRVRRGDNLYAIASRLGVSAKSIAFENNITRMNRIYAGQLLQIPGASPIGKKPAAKPAVKAVAMTEKKSVQAAKPGIKPPEPSKDKEVEPKKKKSKPAVTEMTVVQKNAVIPAAPDKPEKEVVEDDSLKDLLMAPAVVRVDSAGDDKPAIVSNFDVEVYDLETTLSAAGDIAEITVTVDETIGHYADWLGIPTQRIRNLNSMGGGSTIRIDRSIMIPVGEDGLDEFVAARLQYHLAFEEDFYSQFKVADVKSEIIKKGQTLWDLCNSGEEEMPLWLFKKYNKHLDIAKLMPGTEVWLPVIEPKTEEDYEREALQATNPPEPSSWRPLKIADQPARRTP
ncbi:MAG: transglycosylase SLT domain-containing protein [Chitinivibrionales bacterium]|nr:transglycosylase SLT domain-containing protein [Chitinivibrionales bacterium]